MVNQPQLACTISQGREIIGYVVIDSMIRNRALGGLRMSLDVDEAEIRKLARTMTLKASRTSTATSEFRPGNFTTAIESSLFALHRHGH
jgi:hypothetical protein